MSLQLQVKILNIVAAVTGISCILGCGLLVFVVRSELAGLSDAIMEVSGKFQEESGSIWNSLKKVDINPNLLRNRRETFRHLLGRPLSTSSSIGYSSNQVLFKSIGSTERRRKPATKRPKESITKSFPPGPPAAPKVYSYGIQSDVYSDAFDTTSTTSGLYDISTDSYAIPEAMASSSSYDYKSSDVHVDEPKFDFEWEKIQIPKCQCAADNQCPPGPPGPKGSPGHHGEPGEDGKPGESGKLAEDVLPLTPPITHCIMCPQGEPGSTGLDGKRGSRGLRGVRGADGIPGRNGAPGSSGTHGPEGPPGVDGEMGPMGAPGMDGHMLVGLPGSKGFVGAVGEPGICGENGFDGQQGLVGVPGSRGSAGQPGKKGTDGAAGEQGVDGDPGQDAEYCACPRQRQYGGASARLLRA